MQIVVQTHLGSTVGWLFVLVTLGISSLGVYIGRFLRWNSWDLFFRPVTLLQDVIVTLAGTPHSCGFNLAGDDASDRVYAFLWLAPQIIVELQPQTRRVTR